MTSTAPGPGGRPVRVGLLGMYASANLGDTAIQTAVIGALSSRRPDVRFVAVCTDPADAVKTFGLPARDISGFGGLQRPGQPGPDPDAGHWGERSIWPVQRASTLWHISRATRELDMVLVSGSGQIDDFWGGPWEQPLRLYGWTRAARRQRKPVAFFGVGVDQLHTGWGRRLALAALRRAQLRVLRDPGSLTALQSLGLTDPCDVCPDPAFHLQPPWRMEDPTTGPSDVVVISPIARHAWPGAVDERFGAYLSALASLADSVQASGRPLRFVCSQTRMDPPVVALVKARMRTNPDLAGVDCPTTVDDYFRAVRGAGVVVASRLHALILAIVAGTPVVGVSYARKVTQQMSDAGLAHYNFDLAGLDADRLRHTVFSLLGDVDTARRSVRSIAASLRAQLDARLDRLAALIPPSAA